MGADEMAYVVLYDGECHVCSAFVRLIRVLDLRRRIRSRPIQDAGEFLHGIPPGEALGAMHALGPEGRMSTGGDALPTIVAALTGGPSVESLIRSSPPALAGLNRVYRILVAVRGRLTCEVASPS